MKPKKNKAAEAASVSAVPKDLQPVLPPVLAISRAGHDRGSVYLVLGEAEDGLWLTDGRVRPLAKPKKKNCIHVQLVHRIPQTVKDAAYCGSGDRWQDMDTRRVLTAWAAHVNNSKEPMPQSQL